MNRILNFLRKIVLWLFVLHFIYLVVLRWVFPPLTLTQLQSVVSGHGLDRKYVPLQKISQHARLAVIASEDQLFPDHYGFDWKSIEKAMDHNQKKSPRVRGASTLSQQVAKNVFLWQGRSWFRKACEAYFTFMIETLWGKRRILEVYLNVVEMGDGTFGIEAAAQRYFKKPALKLTAREAAMIAAALPSPKRYTIKPMSRMVERRYPWVLRQMIHLKDDPEIKTLLNE